MGKRRFSHNKKTAFFGGLLCGNKNYRYVFLPGSMVRKYTLVMPNNLSSEFTGEVILSSRQGVHLHCQSSCEVRQHSILSLSKDAGLPRLVAWSASFDKLRMLTSGLSSYFSRTHSGCLSA
jgi:hypothetical protein